MGKFDYDTYRSVGYVPQTYGHEEMIDRIITEKGIEGARKYIQKLEKGKKEKRKKNK
jgi:hypothetical protein